MVGSAEEGNVWILVWCVDRYCRYGSYGFEVLLEKWGWGSQVEQRAGVCLVRLGTLRCVNERGAGQLKMLSFFLTTEKEDAAAVK